ncbi:MAG: histidinol-phosphate transaminase [Armatimonadota bacterium]
MPTSPRANLQRLQPYSPGKPIEEVQREYGLRSVIKLASNENPLGPSPRAVEAIRAAAERAHLYPDASAAALRLALSKRLGLPIEQVSVGNGSDELIHYLGVAFLERGDNVVAAHPSFVRYYATAHLADAELRLIPLDHHEAHDLDAMAAAVDERTKLLFIANPNNPTGTIVSSDRLRRLLDIVGESTVVVLDEAYFEFCDSPDHIGAHQLLQEDRRVVGLRTLSKTYGLAGLRVGYLFGPLEWVQAIEKVREPFNVNSLAQTAAIAALRDEEHLQRSIEQNRRGIARLTDILTAAGASVAKSHANFVWARFPFPTASLCDGLLAKGVIIRSGDGFGCPDCVRVSVGTDEELNAFELALKEVMRVEA